MRKVKILIVSDNKLLKRLVEEAIKKVNSKIENCEVILVGQTTTVNEAVTVIESSGKGSIQLIFLGFKLEDRLNGFQLSRKYLNIAYILTSHHPQILRMLKDEKEACSYSYIKHVTNGGNYNIQKLACCIESYIEETKSQTISYSIE